MTFPLDLLSAPVDPRADDAAALARPERRIRRRSSARWRVVSLVTLALLMSSATGADSDEAIGSAIEASQPLPPTQAFAPSATLDGPDTRQPGTLQLDWQIEDGYYLYRDKLSLELVGATDLALGPLQHSDALLVTDDWFGEQAIFRDTAVTRAPLRSVTDRLDEVGTSDARRLAFDVTFQGCADIGLCYPPTTTRLNVELPEASPSADPSATQARFTPVNGGGSALDGLFGRSAAGSDSDLLRPQEAYRPSLMDGSVRQATIDWTIEPGYYLYRDKLSADLVHADGTRIDGLRLVSLPDGERQEDAFFGVTAVLRGGASAVYAFDEQGPAVDEEVTLRLNYQGCADIGVCFPPETVEIDFIATPAATTSTSSSAPTNPTNSTAQAIAAGPAMSGVSITSADSGAAGTLDSVVRSDQDRLSALLADSSLWLSTLTFYGLGLLLAFTPCVLPMVPILSSLIVGQNRAGEPTVGSGLRAFRLSAVYVLVMASTYALAGVLVALSGQNVQVWFQNPILLSAFAALFVVFALAMFGLFELQLPRALQSRLMDASNAQRGRGYRGVVTMGFLSTLIVGPCVTAPLVGALLFIADTGNAWVGGVALFALGLGMGTPLLLVGTSAGSLLPRTGAWMVRVKQGFGILMLGMAVWMLSRFMPPASIALMAGLLALAAGIWLGATDRLDANSGGWPRAAKGVGLAIALYGVAVLTGALAGGHSLLSPLAVFNAAPSASASLPSGELAFRRIATLGELERVVAEASADGRPVMLDFYADWCISCKEMEAFTFTDERVQALLKEVVTVQVDVTANDAQDKQLLERFRLFAPPAIVFFDSAGNELPGARVVGFQSAERFAEHVQRAIGPALAQR